MRYRLIPVAIMAVAVAACGDRELPSSPDVQFLVPAPAYYDCTAQSEIPQLECEALVALYNSTNGPGWITSTNWLQTATPCGWYGVTCSGGSVLALTLGDDGLTGSIPSELGNLSNLTQLILGVNQLTGSIPAELGNLSRLEFLSLVGNQLTGSIPAELGNLSNLVWLVLNNNQLTGSIPTELGNLSNLQNLYLNQCQLTGSIPTELSNLSSLQVLALHGNQLSGTIPAELGSLSNLAVLYLVDNQLTGSIPAELGNLSNLGLLGLSANQLTGSIPAELGNLSNLIDLRLGANQLTGSIPAELGNLSNLGFLVLEDNQLTGSIPVELGNLSNLVSLVLNNNQLTGSIPTELGNLSHLRYFIVSSNKLTGSIPAELGNLLNLTYFILNNNELDGLLPSAVAALAGSIEALPPSIPHDCAITPGNSDLYMPDTPMYRAYDLDGDGFICGLPFTAVIPARIRIVQPDGPDNVIHCTNPDYIIRAVLITTDLLDAADVDHATLLLAGAAEIHRRDDGTPVRHVKDYNRDGSPDLALHVRFGDTSLTCSSVEVVVEGLTYTGQAFRGSVAVQMIGEG